LSCGWLASAAAARSGFLQTRDGQTLEGSIAFTNSCVAITSTNASDPATVTVTQVALTNLSALKFEARAPSAAVAPRGHGNGLLGYYFGNTNATGAVVVRLDQTVDFDWGNGEPVRGVGRDEFKVIWTGDLEAPATGDFTFYISTDDGGRLFVNRQLVAEGWS